MSEPCNQTNWTGVEIMGAISGCLPSERREGETVNQSPSAPNAFVN